MAYMINISLYTYLFREIDDKSLLMKLSLEIEKDTLLSGVLYKYAVQHCSSEKPASWEFVPRKVSDVTFANRILSLPRDQIQQQLTGIHFD